MGRSKRYREFWDSAALNNRTFQQYYDRLVEMAISVFEWKNLPDSVDPRYLELTLFSNGNAIFFRDEVLGFLTLQTTIAGQWDVYNIPKQRRAYATNGYQNSDLTEDNSVVIFNNYLHKPSRLDAEMFAHRLYNLDRAIDVNANAQKTPILIQCDDNERLSLENLYKEYDGNAPVIKGTKSLNKEAFTVLRTDAPYVCDKLYDLKTRIWNEALTYLGISNVAVTKKERLITDEVQRAQGGVIASRYSKLNARKDACKQINKLFGLNVDCVFREDESEGFNEPEDDSTDTNDPEGGGGYE